MLDDKFQLLYSTFQMYIQNYLIERNLNSTLDFINSNNFSGIGTGIDEIVTDYETARNIYSRGIQNVSKSFDISNQNFKFVQLSDTIFLVYGSQDINSRVNELLVDQKGLRHSFIFELANNEFKLTHVHSSLPCSIQNAGESYPLKKLQLENRELEKLVNKRTLELEQALEKIEKIASTDYLTGILNRRKFEEILISYINNDLSNEFCLAIFDIDNFKSINDTYGHMQGDLVLKIVTNIISKNIKACDVFARWGGEEFILLLPNCDVDSANTQIEDIITTIRNDKNNLGIDISVSCGLSKFLITDSLENLVIRVDKALYLAKDNGKDRLEIL